MSWRNAAKKDVKRKRTGGGKEAVLMKNKNKAAPVITLSNAYQKMASFVRFYKGSMVIPDTEWKEFIEGILTPPPLAFRIARTHRVGINFLEARKGAVSQADVLLDKFKTVLLPDIQRRKIDGKPCEMKCLEWYPNEYAWQANFDAEHLKESTDLNAFTNFVIEETSGFNIMRQEIHSMIPPLLLDIKPNHKVLDMFSSPGWMAAQLSEQLYSNPKAPPTGFLITNDTDQTKMQWRWIQGTNMMFLHHDARYMPWLYSSRQHTPENRILFDKILCDAPCSEDGQLGKNAFKRTTWNLSLAYSQHKDQKRFLQRGIELLAQGGELLYTTSSLNPIENEAVVAAVLRMGAGSIKLKDLSGRLQNFKTRPGLSKWKVMTRDGKFFESVIEATEIFKKEHDDSIFPPAGEEVESFGLENCIRVLPHDNKTAGFFCALLTKTGKQPWVSQVSDSESLKEEPEQDVVPPKPTYVKPFKYVFEVKATEIEWSVEKTDNKLKTTVTSDVLTYDKPTPKLMSSSKKIEKEDSTFLNNFMRADDLSWQSVVKYYEITKDFDPTCIYIRGATKSYHLYLHSPVIKQLYMNNKNIHENSRLRNSGLKIFRVLKDSESPDCDLVLSEQGITSILPHMKKRVVKLNREDLESLMTKKSWPTEDLSDTLKASLPEETGCTVFHYSPKGRNAEPKCDIVLVGWHGKKAVKSSTDQSVDIVHYLRLCGIDNPNKQRKVVEAETMSDDDDDDDDLYEEDEDAMLAE